MNEYMNVRTGILSVFCPQVVSKSCSYGYVRQVAVTDENNVFVIQQKSKGKYASLDIAASTFTDNTDVLGSTVYSRMLSCRAFQICGAKIQLYRDLFLSVVSEV